MLIEPVPSSILSVRPRSDPYSAHRHSELCRRGMPGCSPLLPRLMVLINNNCVIDTQARSKYACSDSRWTAQR